MKKVLFGILAVVTTISLVACGEKKEENPTPSNVVPTQVEVVENNNTPVEEEPAIEPESEEQVGVGNTDEGMVVLALEQYLTLAYPDSIEEINFVNVRAYTPEEIEADENLKSHNLKEGDIPFEVEYELKIAENVEDLNQFTAATGEIDGRWIRNKYNVGIARNNGEAGYSIDAFGTGF